MKVQFRVLSKASQKEKTVYNDLLKQSMALS